MAASDSLVCKISPTYVSSDLLTPEQRGRITIPTIGLQAVQPRTLGGRTWGENLTNYGGIGKFPFLGKSRARDLYVTRSLKHFGSGFSQYEANVQPYQLTSLRKSACRVNDQLLPPTFKVELDPTKYVLEPRNTTRQPYFSHRSIFEVFASHDPTRKNCTSEAALTERTRNCLLEQYRQIYDIPSCVTSYPDNSNVIRLKMAQAQQHLKEQQKENAHLDTASEGTETEVSHCHMDDLHELENICVELSPLIDVMVRVREKQSGPREVLAKVYEYFGLAVLSSILTRLDSTIRDESSRRKLDWVLGPRLQLILDKVIQFVQEQNMSTEKIVNMLAPADPDCWVFHDYERVYPAITEYKPQRNLDQETESKSKKLHPYITAANRSSFTGTLIAENSAQPEQKATVKGIAPVWPPSMCYVLNKQKMRLQSMNSFPTNIDLPKRIETQGGCSNNAKVEGIKKRVSFCDIVRKYNPPRYPAELCEKSASSKAQCPGLPSYQSYLNEILPVAGSGAPAAVLPSANPNLTETTSYPPGEGQFVEASLPPLNDDWRTKSIVDPNQHLKTLAQRRYHANHPDLVPDLRVNHRFHKRYFFSGYHTSTFRG